MIKNPSPHSLWPVSYTHLVEDAAFIYDAISLYDEKDSTSQGKRGANTFDTLHNSLKGMKIGIAKEYLDGVRDDVKQSIENAAKIYEELGACLLYTSRCV